MEKSSEKILAEKKKILAEEREVLTEIKTEERLIRRLIRNVWVASLIAVVLILGVSGGVLYFRTAGTRIYIEKSQVSAPKIDLAPQNPGVLQSVFVKEGDEVSANTVVAQVGNELIKTKVAGTIISLANDFGKRFNPGEVVASMIDPNELRVEGSIDEDKGLSQLHVGDRAIFTVDAFGSKQYGGVVDEISPSSNQSDIVFSISDKRAIQQFTVFVRYNSDQYPELKNGMSAKLWIYK